MNSQTRRSSGSRGPAAALPVKSQQCRQCRQHDDKFYCDPCLNSLIVLHEREMARLTLARNKARDNVRQLLGSADATQQELPDPFDPNAAPTALMLLRLIALRAQAAACIDRTENVHMCISQSRQTFLKGKERLKEKRVQILERKQNLAKAWSSLEGSSSNSRAPSKTSGWSTDVYTQYEQTRSEKASPADTGQLGAMIASTRLSVTSLQRDTTKVTSQLKAVRSRLVKQSVSLYAVLPPQSTSVGEAVPYRKKEEMSASSFVAQRFSKLSERYMPGAFVFHQPDVDVRPRASTSGSTQWTISGLSFALPSEVRRHPRESVNAAVTYTFHLLRLVAGYLGMALPFTLIMHRGKLSIRPDPLWDGGGGSSAKPLHLSSAAYAFMTTSATPSTKSESLGASTLSTIESYIQLPSSSSILTSVANAVSKPVSQQADRDSQREDQEEEPSSSSQSSSSKVKPDQAAKAFVSGLVMLSYNVAYLLSKQGAKIDLVTAASNPLQLLQMLQSQMELGLKSHMNYIATSSINDLSMPQLDYEQLAQVLEPITSASHSKRNSAKRAYSVAKPASRTSSTRTPKILEQSYIDAGAAAASVLNIADPSQLSKVVATRVDAKPPSRATATADRQLPSTPPPASLTFLRQRGRDATQPKAVPEDKASKVGPGAVIFNGVEVGVGNVSLAPPVKRSTKSKTDVEEGWNLV